MKINCIIIEDEPLALERMKELCWTLSFWICARLLIMPLDSLAFLKTKVELIFLALISANFPAYSFSKLPRNCQVIFTTRLSDTRSKASIWRSRIIFWNRLLLKIVQAVAARWTFAEKTILRRAKQFHFRQNRKSSGKSFPAGSNLHRRNGRLPAHSHY